MSDHDDLLARLRTEADVSSRYGQYQRLTGLADDIEAALCAERERADRAETRLAAIEDGVRRTADIREAHRKGSGYSLYALLDVTDTPGADA